MRKQGARRRLAHALAAAAVALLLVVAATALANKPRIASTAGISAHYDASTHEYRYHGTVHTERAACRRGRTVKLENESVVGALGVDKTDRHGHWKIVLGSDTLSGRYFARLKRKATHRFICQGDFSRTIPAPSP